jgi:hypothetical protein
LLALGFFFIVKTAGAAITYSVTFIDPGNAHAASYAAITSHVQAAGTDWAGYLAGALQDPTLDLVNSNGVVLRSNNNWRDSQEAAITATGLQPPDDREAALAATVAPGNYTAIVRGVGNTTGIGLVEVYNVQ